MAAEALESDLDLAFNLQLQEAINASLSASFSPPKSELKSTTQNDKFFDFTSRQFDELHKLEQDLNDRVVSETEFKRMRDALHLRIHDHRVAREMATIPKDQWLESGERFERPYGEGSSKGRKEETFRVYVKGLVELYLPKEIVLGGIGVAICDSKDELLFEWKKPVVGNGMSRQIVEMRALIEGLNAAKELDLKRVVFYCDYFPVFNYVTGLWTPKRRNVIALVNQVARLREIFLYCQPSIVARNDIKFAFKLAREAIVSQVNKPAESSGTINLFESCVICLEDKNVGQIFSVDDCMHRYCFSCMKQHIEVKLLHGMLPKCPHEGCNSELKIDSCSKFLTPRLIEIMSQRIKENAIPVTEKVYCPYPKCSTLMSKRERRNPYPPAEDVKLKNLAAMHMWRQCVKCNHMIELAAGCFHMTCRCGYEFCYTCGAEWKNKAASCSCPLWDEDNIVDHSDEDEDDNYENFYAFEQKNNEAVAPDVYNHNRVLLDARIVWFLIGSFPTFVPSKYQSTKCIEDALSNDDTNPCGSGVTATFSKSYCQCDSVTT
ncbi:zinc finger (C3HC4-type RING finger) family protein [Abeliophyllum distichum]|uniref:RBR-type E3 ubiquitin transferase n=1 Tax=Abeliophyllum distichum TaxID=126358 RepID=A0ABD1VUS7_9LAMI